MNIRPVLNKLGFSEKEGVVYLACLEHGPETITNIARFSGLKRSTLYHVVTGLLNKGFLVLVRKKHKTLYDVEKPRRLLTSLRAREQELERILPELDSIRNVNLRLPTFELYEGEDGIRNVYDDIYNSINNTHEVCFLTSIEDLNIHAPFALGHYISRIRQLKEYRVRELIYNDEEGRKYIKGLRSQGFKHPCRLLSPEFPLFNDINMYGDRVAFFSFRKRSVVVVIESPEMTQSVKTLFEWAWKQASSIDDDSFEQ